MTDRQESILKYLRMYLSCMEYPPTRRQIAIATRIPSTSLVNRYLGQLATLGYIALDRNVARGIRLTDKGRKWG